MSAESIEERIDRQTQSVTEAQLFLTRGCNLRCGYCNLAKKDLEDELDLTGWKLAMMNLDRLGFKTVKIMGGEPTSKDWLPELIEFSVQNTDLKMGVLTNGHFSDEYGERLGRAGLHAIFGSVDGLNQIVSANKDAEEKAVSGYRMLQKAKDWGIPLRASNTVINRKNIDQIPEIVERLSAEEIYINLCFIVWTGDEEREYSGEVPAGLKFRPEDQMLINHVSMQLLQMKHDGALISIPDSYLIYTSRHGIQTDWQCSDYVQLRVDADGALMLCNEFRTELAKDHNVLDLTRRNYESFVRDWYKTRPQTECDGCYWSCFIQAAENIHKGQTEFHYAKQLKQA